VLVNNGGINLKKDFTEVTDEEFQRVLLTNGCITTDMSAKALNSDPGKKI
jgi:NAD(P)-dependent dehydrogenase (short-subunit alcohol dehydrogenase family)